MKAPPFDFNKARAAIAAQATQSTGLDDQHVVYGEPELQDAPRPSNPYMTFLFTTPAAKSGDDSKQRVLDSQGHPTTLVNSGGVRKMTVEFNAYADSHEDAYNLLSLWQTALDLEDVQAALRTHGIAVWIIGTVADLSKLLNTGYEGRARMEVEFGIAMNMVSDLGAIESIAASGTVSDASTSTGTVGGN